MAALVVTVKARGEWGSGTAPRKRTLHRADCPALRGSGRPPRDRHEAFVLIDLGHACKRCQPTHDDAREIPE